MSLKLSHIAIANPSIKDVFEKLKVLEFEIETIHEVPTEKVKAAMLPMATSSELRLEILEPTSTESPISKFLEKKSMGGIHHLCFEVKDLPQWELKLKKSGAEILPPGIRKAARGKALFIHPKSMGGVLVELEEIEHS
mgnify:CR=1 FL=1